MSISGFKRTITSNVLRGERKHVWCSQRKITFSRSQNSRQKSTITAENITSTHVSPIQFTAWYESKLAAHPVLTKMISGGILWGVGDAVAQIVPQVADKTERESRSSSLKFDAARLGRTMVFGCFIHSPIAHLHYNFLEWLTVRTRLNVTSPLYKAPIFKAFMEQFVYWGYFSNALYHGCMGGMQGMSPDTIWSRLCDVMWPTMKAQWAFWIPVQLLNFRFVPVRHQLNVVLLTSVVWTAFLSFAFPVPSEAPSPAIEGAAIERS